MIGGVASAKIPKAQLINPDSLITDPVKIKIQNCNFKYEYSLMRQVCIKKDLFSYFFYALAALCFVGIIFAIYGLFFTSLNLLYLRIVSVFSPNKEKVKLAENDMENTEEGQSALMKIFWSSLRWVVIFVLIGLCFYVI